MSLHGPKTYAISAVAIVGLSFRSPSAETPDAFAPLLVGRSERALALSSAPAIAAEPIVVPTTTTPDASVCATGMVLVDGDACPDAEQICLKWLDPPPYENLRCGVYQKPAVCKGPRVHRRFCIDQDEFRENASEPNGLPLVLKTWTEAQALCEQRGARLCKETEWEFACEGADMNPYPYGFAREPGMCNVDRTDLGGPGEKLIDHRAPRDAFAGCTSVFGVHDLTGNVDEWVEREGMAAPHRSSLRGGWWLPGRNRCRAATTHHDEGYGAKQVGFRCCS